MSIVTRVLASGAQKILLAAVVAVFSIPGAVHAANLAPKISGTPSTTATVGTAYSFRPTASDPEGKSVSFGIRNQPSWASFSRTTGQLSGTPRAAGTFSRIEIYAWDGARAASLPRFTITVKAAAASNAAPKISGTPSTTVTAGTAYSFTPTASDANGDTLAFSIQNKPVWASFSTTNGKLSGTPSTAQVGSYANVTISVSDGKVKASLPAFTIAVKAAAASNTAPKISGTPLTAVNAGSAYSFTPTASDANGDKLAFSIQNKPSWASFSTTSGVLAGTPSAAQVGSYANIVISVSDGKATTSLSPFAINVTASSIGAASLSWTAPTQNTDGSALTNLSGYRIYYGTSSGALTQTIQLNNPSVSTYMVENLSPATYYFAVRAITSAGAESALSNVTSKKVN